MMQLFTIEKISQSDSIHVFRSRLDPSHPIFEGHFPGTPVVPGVCTLEMIKRCCGEIWGRELRFDTIKEVKFLAAIIPSSHRELLVEIECRGELSIAVVVSGGVALGMERDAEALSTGEPVTMMKLRATLV